MALRLRGGGGQTSGSSSGRGKRPCNADEGCRQLKRIQGTDADIALQNLRSHEFAELQAKQYLKARFGLPCQPSPCQMSECDIPLPSTEPRDTPTPPPQQGHLFFILHEESPDMPGERPHFSERPPLSIGAGPSSSTILQSWADGAGFKTTFGEQPHCPTGEDLALDAIPMRYKYWHEMNEDHDLAATLEEEPRYLSPPLPLPPTHEVWNGPSPVPIPTKTHLPLRRFSNEWPRHDKFYSKSACDAGHGFGHIDGIGHDHHSDMHISQSLSCPVRDPDTHGVAETLMTDVEAAESVSTHLASFKRRCPESHCERILLSLVHPKSPRVDFELDNRALESIFSSTNKMFFNDRLTQRVKWDWSDAQSNPQYDNKIIGHTSLRRARGGGFETFILLSTPILRSRAYSRRLLISAFLHELIHCYLFICCGWSARDSGGHTDGFRRIADTIDRWVGRENLFLCHVEADLERFRRVPEQTSANDLASQVSASSTPSGSLASSESYSYSLASPVFYNERVCFPAKTNTDWERSLHDRWGHSQGGHDVSHAYGWS